MPRKRLPRVSEFTLEKLNTEISAHQDDVYEWTEEILQRIEQENPVIATLISQFEQNFRRNEWVFRHVMCMQYRLHELRAQENT